MSDALCTLRAAARGYLDRGWSVLPIGRDKKPAVAEWKHLQTRRMSADEVRATFSGKGVTGVGVICGAVSGDLYVRDFDQAEGYARWAHGYGVEARRQPTVRTSRGYHVYGRWPGTQTRKLTDGELRGDGAYVVAPPSIHATGHRYEWAVSLSAGDVPELDPVVAELAPCGDGPVAITTLSPQERHSVIPVSPVDPVDPVTLPVGWEVEVEACVVTGAGQHDERTMDLARLVKATWGVRDPKQWRVVFDYWWPRSRPHCSDQCPDDAWFKFHRACEKARLPHGARNLHLKAINAVRSRPLPRFARAYSNPNIRVLAAVLQEMHGLMGPRFALSYHQIAKVLDCRPTEAQRWMRGLCADELVRNDHRGKPGHPGKDASRWTYLGPLPGDGAGAEDEWKEAA